MTFTYITIAHFLHLAIRKHRFSRNIRGLLKDFPLAVSPDGYHRHALHDYSCVTELNKAELLLSSLLIEQAGYRLAVHLKIR